MPTGGHLVFYHHAASNLLTRASESMHLPYCIISKS